MSQLARVTSRKPSHSAILSSKEMEMLEFLWRWKIVTSPVIVEKFFANKKPNTVYKRLKLLEENKFIGFLQDPSGNYAGWSLTRKGYHLVRSRLMGLKEDGYRSENIHHDLIVSTAHQGLWILSPPENVIVATEQELRRYMPDRLPNWIPSPSQHRPDGYWAVRSGDEWNLISLEVELTQKIRDNYDAVANFYRIHPAVKRVLWIVPSATNLNWLKKVLLKSEDADTVHNILSMEPYFQLGWNAPIESGPDYGKTIFEMLRTVLNQNEFKNPSNSYQNFEANFLLDTRKCSFMLNSYGNSKNRISGVSSDVGVAVKGTTDTVD